LASTGAGDTVVRYLAGRGHAGAVCITPFDSEVWSQQRFQGMVRAAGRLGGEFRLEKKKIDIDFINGPVPTPASRALRLLHDLESEPDLRKLASFEVLGFALHASGVERFERLRLQVVPALSELLESGTRSVWVCINETVGILAMHLLRGRGLQPGKDISVIGFDDSPLAYQYQLTSYNYAFRSIIARSLSFLLDPDNPDFYHRHRIECNGMIIERGSVGH
jgi:DNA-binding LacI/PurR family transcriptional regulator